MFKKNRLDQADEFRVNRRIRSPQLRVVTDDGEVLGVLPLRQALEEAENRGFDLVEVSPNSDPPVAKIMDYGKFKYDKKKKGQKRAKSVKEIKTKLNIDSHDLTFKMNQAKKFLESGHKVKLTVMLIGREMSHKDLGHDLMKRMVDQLGAAAKMDYPPKLEGRNISTVVTTSSK